MKNLGDAQQTVVAQHLAALGRHGLPLTESLPLVIEQLQPSELRTSLQLAQASLARGEVPPPTGDALVTLLVRSETAGPAALSESMHAFTLFQQERETARLGVGGLCFVLGALAALLWTIGTAMPSVYDSLSGASGLPAQTEFVLGIARPAALLCTIALPIVLLFADRLKGFIPGVKHYAVAARLRLYAAGLDAGVPEHLALSWIDPGRPASPASSTALSLDFLEREFLKLVASSTGLTEVAKALASERERLARIARQKLTTVGSTALYVFLGTFIGGILVSLYLPIFRIAGAIK
jgi:hypothetical protein